MLESMIKGFQSSLFLGVKLCLLLELSSGRSKGYALLRYANDRKAMKLPKSLHSKEVGR